MKSKSIFILLISTLISNIVFGQFKKKFKLPDAKIKGAVICGGSCLPGNFGAVLPLYKKTFEPELDDNSNEQLIAYSILGRTYPENDLTGSKAWRCSESINNPFTLNDITRLANTGADGTTFDYTRIEKLNLDINAAVETNLEELKKLNPTIAPATLTEFGAKISAAYSKFAGKDLTIKGKYSQWGLKNDVVESLVKNIGFSDCKKYLKDHNYRIILSIGMVYFDITYAENSVDKVASDLQAQAEQYGIKGNIAVSFKREVSKNLKKTTKGYYQILVWRTAGINDLKL
jgi:hypothetical protein